MVAIVCSPSFRIGYGHLPNITSTNDKYNDKKEPYRIEISDHKNISIFMKMTCLKLYTPNFFFGYPNTYRPFGVRVFMCKGDDDGIEFRRKIDTQRGIFGLFDGLFLLLLLS